MPSYLTGHFYRHSRANARRPIKRPIYRGSVMLKFWSGEKKRHYSVLHNEDTARIDVGAVLLETSPFLPRHRFPEWQVVKRFSDQYDTPHVVLRSVSEPGNRKSLSLQGLVVARKYELKFAALAAQ